MLFAFILVAIAVEVGVSKTLLAACVLGGIAADMLIAQIDTWLKDWRRRRREHKDR